MSVYLCSCGEPDCRDSDWLTRQASHLITAPNSYSGRRIRIPWLDMNSALWLDLWGTAFYTVLLKALWIYFLSRELQLLHALQRQNPKTWCMGPYVEVDNNLTLQYFHSRVDSNTLTMGLGNPIPELEFLNSRWGQGTEQEYGYRTGPPGHIGWRNSFLGFLGSIKV